MTVDIFGNMRFRNTRHAKEVLGSIFELIDLIVQQFVIVCVVIGLHHR